MMNHFDEMTALLYLEGQLEPERAREVYAHTAECRECGELLRALDREGAWLREALETDEEPVPARLLSAPERKTPWGWIAALGLSAGGAYTVWTGIIDPWRAQAAQSGFTQSSLLTMLFFSGTFWKGWDAMRSLTEFLAMSTLTIVVSWVLRRHWRRLTTMTGIVVGAVLLSALALAIPSASAAETEHGHPNYTLAGGQTVTTDLIVFADRTTIDGDVDGDLIAWSQILTVNGHVKGDVICGGQNVRINGTVDGNVRTFAQSLDISGTVGKNVTTWSSETNLEDKGSVGGSFTFGSNDATLAGKIGRDVQGLANDLDVSGTLGRDLTARADHLILDSTADIKGRVKYIGKSAPNIAQGAEMGSFERVISKSTSRYRDIRWYWHRVLLWGVGFVFGLVLLLLMPGFYADATTACKNYAPAAGFGLLFLFATPIAAIIACITVVGLGIGIATLLLYVIAMYASTIFVSGFVGEAILGPAIGTGAAIGRLALGLFILHVLRVLPYIGGWILFIAMFWGFGAMIMSIYKRLRPQLSGGMSEPVAASRT
jgi:cytoskeletal protein CcmA (bactofilin family)